MACVLHKTNFRITDDDDDDDEWNKGYSRENDWIYLICIDFQFKCFAYTAFQCKWKSNRFFSYYFAFNLKFNAPELIERYV